MSDLDDLQKAIGAVCYEWSGIERILEAMASTMLGLPTVSREMQIIAANTDIRGLVDICRSLGILKAPSKQWQKGLDALLLEIDQELRPKRNRVVHDLWSVDGEKTTRIHIRTKIQKARAFAPKSLTTVECVPETPTAVLKLSADISAAGDRLFEFAVQLPGWE